MKNKRCNMKKIGQNPSQNKPLIIRSIDYLVDNLLFVGLLLFFTALIKKIFGELDILAILCFMVILPLASICFKLINKSFSGFIILVLFTLPAFTLALVFLFMQQFLAYIISNMKFSRVASYWYLYAVRNPSKILSISYGKYNLLCP